MPRTQGSVSSDSLMHQSDGNTYLVDGSIVHGQDANGNQLVYEHKEQFPVEQLTEADFQRMRRDGYLRLAEEFKSAEELAADMAARAAEAERLRDENAGLRQQLEALLAERAGQKPAKAQQS